MGSGGGGTTTKSALDKYQKQASEELWTNYLQGRIGEPMEAFGPTEAITPTTPYSEYYWSPAGAGDIQAQQLMQQFASTPREYTTTGMIPEALSGLSPDATRDWYMEHIYPQARREFEEQALPAIGERYVGPGAFWSGERRGAESRAITGFGEAQMANLGQAIVSNRQQAIGMMPQIQALEQAQFQEPLGRAQVATAGEEMHRQLYARELSARLEEFKRTRPEYAPYVDQALAYISTTTQMAYGTPGGPNLMGALGGAGMGALGGYQIGGPWGAAAGGVAGLLGGLSQ